MSGIPAFYALNQGNPAPAQQQQGHGNPVPINQAGGYGAVPCSMMVNQRHPQYQQQRDFQHMNMHNQYQQPHHPEGFRHTPERPPERRIEETSDIRHEAMTPSAMCDFLSTYIVYDLEKDSVEDEVDEKGNPAQPTWGKAKRMELPVEKYGAAQEVFHLKKQGTVQQKMAKLKPLLRRQVEELQDNLEEDEEDPRYCIKLMQLDQTTRTIPYEQYLRDPRNLPNLNEKELKLAERLMDADKNGRKLDIKLKPPKGKDGKPEKKKETKSITVYFKRTPRPEADVVGMFEMETNSGRATHSWENVERRYQSHHRDSPIHHQDAHCSFQQSQQHKHAPNLPQAPHAQQQPLHAQQQPPYAQQQPQYVQQHQSQYPQQHIHNVAQQGQQQSRPAQQARIPVPPQTVLPAAQRDHNKPIIIQHGSAQKIKGEPVRIVNVSPNTKNKQREKRYSAHSPRSSRSSIHTEEDDIFSAESETTWSSMASDYPEDKRGRTKRRGKGRRERSESTAWSGNRSRGRDRSRRRSAHRPEFYGVRQHTIGDRRPFENPPPAPPSTEKGYSPDIVMEAAFKLGKMQGQKEASGSGIDESVSPRVTHAPRHVMRDMEEDLDGLLVRDRVYEGHGYGIGHDGSGRYPVDKVYPQAQPMPLRPSNQVRQPPAHIDRAYQSVSSDDYSDDQNYEYTYTPARARPQSRQLSPERRGGYEQAFSQSKHLEGPYMSGGLQDFVDRPNPFKPMPRR